MNNYTANNSSVNDVVHDMVTGKHNFFKCTKCTWENGELVMCDKCTKYAELHNKVAGDQELSCEPPLDGGSNWELLGCLIYVFGIVAAFVLLIWSTM